MTCASSRGRFPRCIDDHHIGFLVEHPVDGGEELAACGAIERIAADLSTRPIMVAVAAKSIHPGELDTPIFEIAIVHFLDLMLRHVFPRKTRNSRNSEHNVYCPELNMASIAFI